MGRNARSTLQTRRALGVGACEVVETIEKANTHRTLLSKTARRRPSDAHLATPFV